MAQGIAASVCWSAPPLWSNRKKYISKCLMNFHGTLNRHSWRPVGKPPSTLLIHSIFVLPDKIQKEQLILIWKLLFYLLTLHKILLSAFSVDTGRMNMQVSFGLFFQPNSNGVFAEENSDAKLLVYTHTHRKKGEAHTENIWMASGQTFFLSHSKQSQTATVRGFL